MLSTATQLVLLLVAAFSSLISQELPVREARIALAVTAACFFLAAVLKVHALTTKAERLWYEARAVAESVKSLAWRYAVGSEPFRVDN